MPDQLIHPIASAVTAFVGATPSGPVEPRLVTSMSSFAATFGGLSADLHLGYSVRDFFRHGGTTAVIVRVDPNLEVTDGIVAGLHSLGTREVIGEQLTDPVGLVVVPPIGVDADGTTWVDPDPRAIDEAIATAARIGAVAILDPPATWASPGDALSGVRRGGQYADAVQYFPRVVVPDPLHGGRARAFAPSGAVAGLMARTDARDGVWDAPAGVDATLAVEGLTVALRPEDFDALNGAHVNTLRTIPTESGTSAAVVVWGARTLGMAEWKYVPIRRLCLYLEHSVARGLRWTVFEPNGEPLWARVRATVEEFLVGLWRQGAFQGVTSREAFFVRCDRTTMTQDDLDAGRIIVHLGVAPLKPAEFITLHIEARAGG